MTISVLINRVQYTGDGATVNFDYVFRAFNEENLRVIFTDADTVETALVLDTDYTVADNGDETGGTITLIGSYASTPPTSSEKITILRQLDITQEVDYPENDPFPSQSHENAIDRNTAISQDLSEQVGRAIKLKETSTLTNITIDDGTEGTVPKFDADGNLVVGPTADEISNAQTYATNAATSATTATTQAGIATTQASNAAGSAAAAAAAAASNLFNTLTSHTDADSPVTIAADTDDGTFFVVDSSSGNVSYSLPSIATAGEGERYGFLRVSASNVVTLVRDGTDTINGVDGNYTLAAVANEFIVLVADETTPDNWIVIPWSQVNVGAGLSKSGSTVSLDLTSTNAWTGPQRAPFIPDNDGSFDMNAGQNFSWTPTGADTLEFTNETNGQSGLIVLNNGSDYTITLGTEVKAASGTSALLSQTGLFLISYVCYDGTNVIISNTEQVS